MVELVYDRIYFPGLNVGQTSAVIPADTQSLRLQKLIRPGTYELTRQHYHVFLYLWYSQKADTGWGKTWVQLFFTDVNGTSGGYVYAITHCYGHLLEFCLNSGGAWSLKRIA